MMSTKLPQYILFEPSIERSSFFDFSQILHRVKGRFFIYSTLAVICLAATLPLVLFGLDKQTLSLFVVMSISIALFASFASLFDEASPTSVSLATSSVDIFRLTLLIMFSSNFKWSRLDLDKVKEIQSRRPV